jgi:hypothetical protein
LKLVRRDRKTIFRRREYAADAGDDDDEACCNCGLKAARLTVSKEGAICAHARCDTLG